MASRKNGTIYTGVTNDVRRRVWEHKHDLVKGFTREYGVHLLVHFEQTESIDSAILREKQIKSWKRKWKLALIEESNPNWLDLYDSIL